MAIYSGYQKEWVKNLLTWQLAMLRTWSENFSIYGYKYYISLNVMRDYVYKL